jgi:hypothetical protein
MGPTPRDIRALANFAGDISQRMSLISPRIPTNLLMDIFKEFELFVKAGGSYSAWVTQIGKLQTLSPKQLALFAPTSASLHELSPAVDQREFSLISFWL